ncbi:tripartite motif-containing protein 2-like [Argopecten irradians]|uniref:tripartite motif-containing protein 2-like n=1 Tax=Argopecten irradians TaxID=31199 RepID=UPI00371243F8
MATANVPVRTEGQTTCNHHKGRQLDLYCEKCQEPICLKCISTIHRIHPVCELIEVTPQKKQDIRNFIDRTEQNDLVQIGKYITSTDTLLKDNESIFEKLSDQLDMQIEKLKQDLDKLRAETLSLYQNMKDDNIILIQKYKQELEMYDKELKQQMLKCKKVLQQGSHIEIYDTKCEIDSRKNIPVKPGLDTVSFNPNNSPKGHLLQALGEVITSGQGHTSTDRKRSVALSDGQQQPSSQQQSEDKGKKAVARKTLLTETKVVEEWKSPCVIGSICPTTDDQAWTSDYSNTLTLLNRNGTVIQKVTHKTGIMDISVSPTTHRLWACDQQNNILELVSGQLIQQFTTKTRLFSICITAKNHVIVGMSGIVSKYTTQGQMVITTMASGIGKPFMCTAYRITECPITNNVAVIGHSDERDGGDGNSHVVVMDTYFQQLFVYRGDIPSTCKQSPQTGGRPFNPYDIVYDSQGSIIVGNYYNKNVVLLSKDGKGLGILHTDRDSVWAVSVGRDDLLWIPTGFMGDCVKMLQYYKM